MIKISRIRQMGFTCIWTKAKCLLDSRFSQTQPCRRMVEPEKIELLMCVGELAYA